MRKALSLILALCMLASLCTVPAMAEEEFDIPVIEEVTEAELEEEFELFGEEATEEEDSIFVEIERSDNDGITLLADLEGVSVTYTKVGTSGPEGTIESLYNGIKTTGDDFITSLPKNGNANEGYMIRATDTLTIDLGEKRAFSGIRIWETARARSYQTYGNDGSGTTPRPDFRKLSTSRIYFSDDGETWYKIAAGTVTHDSEAHTSDIPFAFNNTGTTNLNARYIKFENTTVLDGGVFELEEIAMIDANPDLNTWSLTGYEMSTDIIESVTAGSVWGGNVAASAYDNNLSLNSYWHSDANIGAAATDEHRSLTIKLKEATEIGGIRLWPRNDGTKAVPDQHGASLVRKVKLFGSTDGETWVPITLALDNAAALAAVGYAAPMDIILPPTLKAEYTYFKITGLKVNNYVCLPEFQLLSTGIKAAKNSYVTKDDVITLTSMPAVIDGGNSYDNSWKNSTTNPFSGVIYQNANKDEGFLNPWTGVNSGDPHMEDNFVYFDGDKSGEKIGLQTAWADIDLGKNYTFSALRLFARWNQYGQSLTKGYVLVSDNGTDWHRAELYSDSYTQANNMAKYNSTGDCYIDLPLDFGEKVNVTARYVRIYCTATGGGDHWSWQQAMLVKPVAAYETKTVTQLVSGLQVKADAVEALVAKIPQDLTGVSEDAIAARELYEALPEAAKPLVSAESLAKLEATEAATASMVCTIPLIYNFGINKATFTLPVRENMEIKSVTYVDSFGNTIDGTYATSVTSDGENMTITMDGQYVYDTGLTGFNNGSKTYYYGRDNSTFGFVKGEEIKTETFKGRFVCEVTFDGIGDHLVKVTFGDDVTYTVNIKTTYTWKEVSGAAAIADSEFTDEVTPKSTWKTINTSCNTDMSNMFDGKVEYNLRKAGSTSGNRWESTYVTSYVAETSGEEGKNQVILYPPTRVDIMVDTGEATEVSGIRIYPRIGTYDEDKTKGSTSGVPTKVRYWGSDDGENWDVIGDYNFGTNCGEKTAEFGRNVNYRYYKASVTRANTAAYRATINISEFVFLKAKTHLASEAEVNFDAGENNEATYSFELTDSEAVTSVKDASGNEVEFEFENGELTIDAEYLKGLANGTYAFTVAFSNAQTFSVSVVKVDTSKVSYMLFGKNTSGDLVLEIPTAKAVESLKFESGAALEFTTSGDGKSISVIRQIFRRTTDIYSLIDVDEAAQVKLIATYAEGGSKTFTITVDSQWQSLAGTEITAEYADDEIPADLNNWKARVSSGQDSAQPANTLTKAPKSQKDSQNWHTFFTGANGGDSTVAIGHYFEIDFGENMTPYRGIRHRERAGGTTWNKKVTITAKNNASDAWVKIFEGVPAYELIGTSGSNNIYEGDMIFDDFYTYRYVRIHIVSSSAHMTADTLRILKAETMLTSEDTIIVDVSENEEAAYTFKLVADETIASVKDATGNDATYTFEGGVLTLGNAYLATLADGEHTFTVTFTSGKAIDVKVIKTDYSRIPYVLSDANGVGTSNVVITSKSGKVAKAITVNGVAVTEYAYNGGAHPAFEMSDDNKTITIPRYNFRRLIDYYGYLGLAEDATCDIPLVVTYEDDTTKTYTVIISAGWVATPEVKGTFAADEITPVAGEWKIRTSSANGAEAHPRNAFTGILRNATDDQNWHTAYVNHTGTSGAKPDTNLGHYIDVDFGANAPTYKGVRITQRVNGSKYTKIVISGKDTIDGDWVELFDGQGLATAPESNNLVFENPVSYRYLRIHFQQPGHMTADTIRLIADTARLTSDNTVVVDSAEAEDAKFTFYLPEDAKEEISVALGENAVSPELYTFEDGVLTIKGEYTITLPDGNNTLTVTIDGIALEVIVAKQNKYQATYALSGTNGRGTDDLKLLLHAGKTPASVKYGNKEVTFTADEKEITVKRYIFRDLDDFFDKATAELTVTFSDETVKTYTVTFENPEIAITGINTAEGVWASDEIVPAEGAWTLKASASHGDLHNATRMFAKVAGDLNWHSAYTEVATEAGTKAQPDSTTNRQYLDVNFGTATKISGFRYYIRKDGVQTAGNWLGATVYGKNAASDEWTLIKSQSFDHSEDGANSIYAKDYAEVFFTEDVTYSYIRIVVDCADLATGKGFAFLNARPEVEVEEEEVNIKITPSTGGNVFVVEGEGENETSTPSQGDNVVKNNTETTFKVGDTTLFQYWIEANTGKVLGHDEYLKVKATVGKDIKAVFADPDSTEVFVSFYGRNAKAVVSHGYIKKGEAPKTPSIDKLYTTGYEFEKWVDKDGNDVVITEALTENKSFYATYTAKAAMESTITVTNGTVKASGVAAAESGTFAYDTRVTVTANDPKSGYKFSHFTANGKIVSYDNPYKFYAPDADLAIEAVYVEDTEEITKALSVTLSVTKSEVNGISVASFLATRVVPEGATVIETGIIYAKDAAETNLTVEKVGTTSVNGKAIKVATSDKTTSGQYKLTASYYAEGIAARGFITYLDGETVKTVYSDILTATK